MQLLDVNLATLVITVAGAKYISDYKLLITSVADRIEATIQARDCHKEILK